MGSVTVGLGWDVDQGEVDLDVSAAPHQESKTGWNSVKHTKREGNDMLDDVGYGMVFGDKTSCNVIIVIYHHSRTPQRFFPSIRRSDSKICRMKQI